MQFIQTDNPIISPSDHVKVREMGNITEVIHLLHKNNKQYIQKIDKDHYVLMETGEIKPFVHSTSRADNKKTVARSLKKLRDIINTNVIDVKKCRWVTLTYAENMTDEKRLYTDFKKFILRLNYYCEKEGHGKPEYIVSCEPQGRGAWHCHVIFIFPNTAPFISNEKLRSIWRQGYVMIKKIDENVDNIGAYLSAYLGDMELTEYSEIENQFECSEIKAVTVEENGKQKEKYFVKGARLRYYPPGFNIYRVSKGIKKPIEYETFNSEIMEKVSSDKLTFQKTLRLYDDNGNTLNRINYRYYKHKINKSQDTTPCVEP